MLFQIELHHIPGEAVAALMDAIREKNKHKEVMKAIKETNDVGQLDDSTVRNIELNTYIYVYCMEVTVSIATVQERESDSVLWL